jgi:formylglycine-generating enzyme required for sulfatase activity
VTGRAGFANRAAVGRADLLRALAVRGRDQLALIDETHVWFGYQRRPEVAPPTRDVAASATIAAIDVGEAAAKLPLTMGTVVDVVLRETKPTVSPDAPRAAFKPLGDDAGTPRSPGQQLAGNEDLVPAARLLPALRLRLATRRPGMLDIAGLTHALAARARLPPRLPRRKLSAWHPDLAVVLDLSPRLWLFHWDFHRLLDRLVRLTGHSGVSVREVDRAPTKRGWVMPQAGAPVLLVSDLGLCNGETSPEAGRWRDFVVELRRARTRPVGLAPLSAQQLPAALARLLPILRWSPDATMLPARGHDEATAWPAGTEDLLAMMCHIRRVDPPLLRALRRINPHAPLDAGLEGAAWCHPDIAASYYARLRPPPWRADHAARFVGFDAALQLRINDLRRLHHAHQRAGLDHEEMLAWASHAHLAASADASVAKPIADAHDFLARLARSIPDRPVQSGPDWRLVASGIVERADAALRAGQEDVFHELVARLIEGDEHPVVPDWADPTRIADISSPVPIHLAWLVEDPSAGGLRLQTEAPRAGQRPRAADIAIDSGGLRIRWPGQPTQLLRAPGAFPLSLPAPEAGAPIEIDTSRERLVIAAVQRPRGAFGWSAGSNGITVTAAQLGIWHKTWRTDELRLTHLPNNTARWTVVADPSPSPASNDDSAAVFGIDAEFGVFAELLVRSVHGEAAQRLRWIEPGRFLMGSPPDEPERADDEGPRHAVTLTRGFWLADTACTQLLWQAVTGSNPSRFTGDGERPVEQVSWHDVQGFLRALEALLPGCRADLPSEAEWEYACRAGTQTPFSFGGTISPAQVNYDGNSPYAGAAKGEYRKQPVPVRRLPANGWGLYEMHGNVWEWCADGRRTYTDAAQTDPRGPLDDDSARAVRGGSWSLDAWGARSAYRAAIPPVGLLYSLGFRLCLRSIEPG